MRYIHYIYIILCLFTILCLQSVNLQARTAIIISIDGLRPDAITSDSSPNVFNLLGKSSYTLKANTVYPSITIPAHTSLLTGLDVKNHMITFNKWKSDQPSFQMPTIFTIMDANKLSYSFICGKKKLLFLLHDYDGNTVKCYDVDEDDRNIEKKITADFLVDFRKRKPAFTFVHFPQPDHAGHSGGWMSPAYMDSFHTVDNQLGSIVGYLGKLKDNLLIITADHGGHDKTHGTKMEADMTIPWIAFGDSIKKNHIIQQKVYIYDSTPTVLKFLGVDIPDDLDGKPVEEIFN